MKTWGEVVSPKHKTLNWKMPSEVMNLRKCLLSGWTGTWRYASFRSNDTVQSYCLKEDRTDWTVSILNLVSTTPKVPDLPWTCQGPRFWTCPDLL